MTKSNPDAVAYSVERKSFLTDVVIKHGPSNVLGRFFLAADAVAKEHSVTLSFGTADELVAVNRANAATWKPVLPIFNPAFASFAPSDFYCLLGRNSSGEVVTAQAGRLFDWSGTTFAEETSSLRLLYADPANMRGAGERIDVRAPSMDNVTGRVVFSGASWQRPDIRGKALVDVTARLSRAMAYALWGPDCVVTFCAEHLVARDLPRRAGFKNTEWEINFHNTPLGTLRAAVLWMTRQQLLDELGPNLVRATDDLSRLVDVRATDKENATI